MTVPKLGAGPPPTPATVAVNVTGAPNAADVAGLATNVTVGVASAIE
ncbi:MAG: hypothetical protein ACJ72N_07805 [Labedaea sp.]